MSILNAISLKRKIQFLLVVHVVLFVLLCCLLYGTKRLQASMKSVSRDYHEIFTHENEVKNITTKIFMEALVSAIGGKLQNKQYTELQKKLHSAMLDWKKRIDKTKEPQRSLFNTHYNKIESQIQVCEILLSGMTSPAKDNSAPDAVLLLYKEHRQFVFESFKSLLNELIEQHKLHEEAFYKKYTFLNGIIYISALFFIPFSGLAGFLFFRHMMSSMAAMIEAVKLTAGKAYSQSLPVSAPDEMGELAQAFNEMIVKLQTTTVSREYYKAVSDQLKNANQIIEEKAAELADASRAKSQFLANMSHELRTPLNSILILSGMMKENRDESLNQKQLETLDIIYKAGKDLVGIVDDILDLSKVEAGKLDLYFDEVSVSELAKDAELLFRETAEKKGIDFQVTIEVDVPTFMVTDSKRINQILRNFLSNAMKFTEKGSVEFGISIWGEPENDVPNTETPSKNRIEKDNDKTDTDKILFSVKDTGIGIPKDKLSLIFESFQQVDGSITRIYGGTGLGLSISKELAGLLGGDIEVTSTEGKGATFRLCLPVVHPMSEKSGQEIILKKYSRSSHMLLKAKQEEGKKNSQLFIDTAETCDIQIEGVSILIIDDDMRNVYALTHILENHGMHIEAAVSGQKGLELLSEKQSFGCVLLDIMMGDMDGYETLKKMKENPLTMKIPVVAVTALASRNEKEKCLELGFNDFVSKPIDIAELLLKMKTLIPPSDG